jgi:hypothetical protein
MRNKWLAYISFDHRTLKVIALDGDLAPQQLVTVAPPATDVTERAEVAYVTVTENFIWYQQMIGDTRLWCSISLTNLTQSPSCTQGSNLTIGSVTSSEDTLFVSWQSSPSTVESYRLDGTRILTLLNPNSAGSETTTRAEQTVFAQGFLYSLLGTGYSHWLVRFPATVGRLPQAAIADPGVASMYTLSGGYVNSLSFTVSDAGVFWTQPVTNLNQPQYIFHAPLPPQPCDAELPCANTAQVCTNNVCVAP